MQERDARIGGPLLSWLHRRWRPLRACGSANAGFSGSDPARDALLLHVRRRCLDIAKIRHEQQGVNYHMEPLREKPVYSYLNTPVRLASLKDWMIVSFRLTAAVERYLSGQVTSSKERWQTG